MIATTLTVTGDGSVDTFVKMFLLGLAAGCLLAGIAIGASSRARPLLAACLGGGVGVAGFCLMVIKASEGHADSDTKAGMAVFAIGGAIVTLIGALIGWAAVGKRAPGAVT
ncbi:MAG: hypothetical protein ACM31C_02210 [Acidobacteriota bacterium]